MLCLVILTKRGGNLLSLLTQGIATSQINVIFSHALIFFFFFVNIYLVHCENIYSFAFLSDGRPHWSKLMDKGFIFIYLFLGE